MRYGRRQFAAQHRPPLPAGLASQHRERRLFTLAAVNRPPLYSGQRLFRRPLLPTLLPAAAAPEEGSFVGGDFISCEPI